MSTRTIEHKGFINENAINKPHVYQLTGTQFPGHIPATLILEIPEPKIEITRSQLEKAWDKEVMSGRDSQNGPFLNSSRCAVFKSLCRELGLGECR